MKPCRTCGNEPHIDHHQSCNKGIRAMAKEFSESASADEITYTCPVCQSTLEHGGSWGFGGVTYTALFTCPNCKTVSVQVDMEKLRARKEAARKPEPVMVNACGVCGTRVEDLCFHDGVRYRPRLMLATDSVELLTDWITFLTGRTDSAKAERAAIEQLGR